MLAQVRTAPHSPREAAGQLKGREGQRSSPSGPPQNTKQKIEISPLAQGHMRQAYDKKQTNQPLFPKNNISLIPKSKDRRQ